MIPRREDVVRTALEAAEAEWRRRVHDKAGHQGIERIRGYIAGGLGWPVGRKYAGDGDFAWCGAFVAWCYAQAGLHAEVRKRCFSSTYRLTYWAMYASEHMPQRNVELPSGETMPVDAFHRANGGLRLHQAVQPGQDLAWAPEPGDIALVGPPTGKPYGAHVTLVRDVDLAKGRLLTVEGNASGLGPTGERYAGVVHHERPLPYRGASGYVVRVVLRPALADFVPEVEYLP